MSTPTNQNQTNPMPALFIGHGSPLSALDNAKAAEFGRWAQNLAQPTAILVISAHWETTELSLGELIPHQELIYDFGGFPEKLYQLQYPAPGSPWLAQQIQTLLKSDITVNQVNRGLDHGVWIPLRHMWPDANIPVLQMSLPLTYSNKALFELGKKLSPLREQAVLIICSGMITHNLSQIRAQAQLEVCDWAKSFDDWVKDILLQGNSKKLLDWQSLAPFAHKNHPTTEHFQVLLIAAGTNNLTDISFPIEGFEAGIFSRRSIQFN